MASSESEEVAPSKMGKTTIATEIPGHDEIDSLSNDDLVGAKILRKIDLRLCTIAGLLCSLNLLDSGILSSASVTSMPRDLGLTGNRFSVAIFIFTVASICAQLPATLIMRFIGPPIFFSCTTFAFGLITLCTAWVTDWKEMIALRVLLGISMSGIYPGLSYLISTWYERKDQQLRYAFLQSGEVIILATGSIVNFGLNKLDGTNGLRGWQYMYIVQGTITMFIGLLTYLWIPHFPENSHKTIKFLTDAEIDHVLERIDHDRKDAGKPDPFSFTKSVLIHFLDPKLYAFSLLFFLVNIVSTALAYFTPIILQSGMGFSTSAAIILSAPPYYYAVVPVIATSLFADRFRIRGPVIIFNAICLIIGFCMLGFAKQVTVRYVGVFLATGAYVSNWAAVSAYQQNNVHGQWMRATFAAASAACNGLGGIAGSYIVRAPEAPRYPTAVWVSIGSHLLMIMLIGLCTLLFWRANKRTRRGKISGENSLFFYTY